MGDLTDFSCFIRVVSYGIKDKHCGNLDIKLRLILEVGEFWDGEDVEKGIDIHLDNVKEFDDQVYDEDDEEFYFKRSIKIEGDVK